MKPPRPQHIDVSKFGHLNQVNVDELRRRRTEAEKTIALWREKAAQAEWEIDTQRARAIVAIWREELSAIQQAIRLKLGAT